MTDCTKWFPFSKKISLNDDTILVFCFHHAGSSASVYMPWTKKNDEHIAFIPIELPGKGCRMAEDYIFNMDTISSMIAKAISEFADGRRYILYGHSMGSAVAFKTAYELEQNYSNKPLALMVSGRHSACIHFSDRYSTDMDDSALIDELKLMGGTPKEILENEEVLKIIIPFIKNDYKLNETFIYNNEVLSIPIIAYAGSKDHDASFKMMDAWKDVTTGKFSKYEYSGEHFFIFDLGDYYIDVIKNDIYNLLYKKTSRSVLVR